MKKDLNSFSLFILVSIFISTALISFNDIAFAGNKQRQAQLIAEGDKLNRSAQKGMRKTVQFKNCAKQKYNEARQIARTVKRVRDANQKRLMVNKLKNVYKQYQNCAERAKNMGNNSKSLSKAAAMKYYEAKELGDWKLRLEKKFNKIKQISEEYRKEVIRLSNKVAEMNRALASAVAPIRGR